jgi:hypothetical protein
MRSLYVIIGVLLGVWIAVFHATQFVENNDRYYDKAMMLVGLTCYTEGLARGSEQTEGRWQQWRYRHYLENHKNETH